MCEQMTWRAMKINVMLMFFTFVFIETFKVYILISVTNMHFTFVFTEKKDKCLLMVNKLYNYWT